MSVKENCDIPVLNLRKIFSLILSIYTLLVFCFYYLAGDQLRFRNSRGNIAMPVADAAVIELSQGVTVEQVFLSKIQRLESISVQWGAYYRTNLGTVSIDVLRQDNGVLLMHDDFEAASIDESSILTVQSESSIASVFDVPLIIRLYSTSKPGQSVAPLMDSKNSIRDGFSLSVDGKQVPGTLCFSASGTDYIWTGVHYWEFAVLLGVLLVLLGFVIHIRFQRGKHSYIVNAMIAVKKYRFLISQLISRDFKTKYKRSILGVFWSFLNPLLMMLVQFFVFSTLFRSDIPNFAAYLIIGTVMFNFFSESCGMSLMSILGNAGLLTKVYMPKYIYPLTRTMSSVINLAISLIPMVLVCLATGVQIRKSTVLALFFFICLVIFCLGFGMLLSTSMVFFRDTQFLWSVVNMIWMYATPIFYPVTIIPDNLRFISRINPLYHFLNNARICILDGVSPEPTAYVQCLLIALSMLLFGAFVFYRNQDKFILYL